MLTYTSTIKKFSEGLYTAFELGYFEIGKREPLRVLKHAGESPEEAQERLKQEVGNFPAGTRFEIQAKKDAKANTDTAHVWQFTNVLDQAAPPSVPGWPGAQMPQAAGFSGFGNPFGAPDLSEIKEERRRLEDLKEQLMNMRFDLKLAEAELKRKEEKHAEQVARDREVLGSLEKKYNSTTGAARRGVEMLLGEALEHFGRDGHFGSFAGKLMGLGSAPAELSAPQPEDTQTPEREAIEELAAYIDGENLTLRQIKALHRYTISFIQKMRENELSKTETASE